MKSLRWIPALLTLCLLYAARMDAQNALVNQSGYLPGHVKYVYFISPDDSFSIVEKGSGRTVFTGPVQVATAKDPSAGLRIHKGDFSAFTQEGTYQVSTPSADTSSTFTISRSVFEDVYKKSLKGFFFQRCGIPLLAANAGVYARATCHIHDGTFHSSADRSGTSPTTGGWHDAGDYGKYVVNAGVTVGTMLLAYELFPAKFKYDDLNIPESGNGVPDILDEVRFELEWFLTMQDTADGGVYFKVTTANFDGFEMPSQDVSVRYIYQKSSTATGDFAGAMAQAARVYAPFDGAFASHCLAAARKAWDYLQAHASIVPTGGFHNPSGTGTGEYGDGSDSDERLWAAAELYETTGENSFHAYFTSNYNISGIFTSSLGWPDVRALAQAAYLIGKQAGASSSIKAELQGGLNTYCSYFVSLAAADGFNVTLRPVDYGWGSNGGALNIAVLLILGYTTSGNAEYYNTALSQLNYILGCNRHNMTFVTGVGSLYPMNPHHRPSYSDGVVEPIPGLMAGGPDSHLDDDVLKANFSSTTPPARCYIDDWRSYASNEIAVNWNAPLVFVSGYFNESPVTSVRTVAQELPRTVALSQNYPNPFNPSTVIAYQLRTGSMVRLALYDVLGREVRTLVQGQQEAGTHTLTFDAAGMPSGVYFYRLQAEGASITKKMTVLR